MAALDVDASLYAAVPLVAFVDRETIKPPRFEQFDGRVIVAYYAEFDVGFLEAAFQDMGFDSQLSYVCSIETAQQWGIRPTKLQDVADHFGLTGVASHIQDDDGRDPLDDWEIQSTVRSGLDAGASNV